MNIHVTNVCWTVKPSFIIANTLENIGLGGFMDEFRVILTNIYCGVFTVRRLEKPSRENFVVLRSAVMGAQAEDLCCEHATCKFWCPVKYRRYLER